MPVSKLSRITVLTLFLAFPAFAASAVKLNVSEGGKNLPAQQKTQWVWIKNEEQVKELRLRALVRSDTFTATDIASTTSEANRAAKAVMKSGIISALLSSTSTSLEISSRGKNRSIKIQYSPENHSVVVDDDCRHSAQVVLRPQDSSAPFYVGIGCTKDVKGLNVTLSYPSDVELIDASFSEVKGKGESWKYYELGPIQQTLKDIGHFTLTYRGKNYRYDLISVRQLQDTEALDNSILSVGLGFSLLGIKGSDGNFSSGSPTVIVRVPHYSLIGGLGLSLALDFAIPISSGVGAVKFSQFGIYGDYMFTFSSALSFMPKIGYLITSQSEESTSIGLAANQLAFGGVFRYHVGADYLITLEGLTAGIGSPGINSHYLFDVGFTRKKVSSYGWGVGFRMQNFSATSALAIQRTFSQMLFYGLLSL